MSQPEQESRVTQRVIWTLAVLAAVVAVVLITRTLIANYTTDLSAPGGTFWDFRDASYYSVRGALDGLVPYDVDAYFAAYPVGQEYPVYPPTYLVLHAPFQLLNLTSASIVMLVLNAVGIVALSAWSISLGRYRVTPLLVLVVSTLVAVSTGGRNLLISGQSSLVFVAGTYLAVTASGATAGAAGVFLTLIKPGFGLPVTLLVAASGRLRRAVLGTGVAVLVSAILMIPFLVWAGGIGPLTDILVDNMAFSTASKWIALETTTARVDVAATLAILLDLSPPDAFEVLTSVVVIGGAAVLLYARRKVLGYGHFGDAAIVLICLVTVAGIYHSFYDLVILVLPAILLSRSDFASGHTARGLRLTILVAVLLASFNPFKVDSIVRLLPESARLAEILGAGLTGAALAVALGGAAVVMWQLPTHVSNHIGTTDSR